MDVNKNKISILLLSDTRYGSKYEQPSIVNDIYNRAHKHKCDFAIHLGDISEGIYSGVNKIYNETLFAYGVNEQAEHIINFYPNINIPTYFITGEHDARHLINKTSEDIGNLIEKGRDDMFYLGGNQRLLRLKSDRSKNFIDIKVNHTKKNFKPPYTISYRNQQTIKSMRSEDKPDLYVNGHYLVADSYKYRDIDIWQVPSTCATTPEMEAYEFNNTIGAWVIDIYKDKNNDIKHLENFYLLKASSSHFFLFT